MTDARVLRTKKNIQEVTISLLTTQPDFSISTLIERSQITRGTFYKYYRNKEHLIADVNNSLILELTQYTKHKFLVIKMIETISNRGAFYNAVLNLGVNQRYRELLMSQLHSQMQTQLESLSSDTDKKHLSFQWEAVMGGFWAIIGAWLLDNMNVDHQTLLQEFTEILRINTTGIQQTGLQLFDFEITE